MTDHTGAGSIVGSARKARAERDHDCERQGHRGWTEVRNLDSVTPIAFLCGECGLALHVGTADLRAQVARLKEIAGEWRTGHEFGGPEYLRTVADVIDVLLSSPAPTDPYPRAKAVPSDWQRWPAPNPSEETPPRRTTMSDEAVTPAMVAFEKWAAERSGDGIPIRYREGSPTHTGWLQGYAVAVAECTAREQAAARQAWEEGFSAAIAGWNDRQLNVPNPYAGVPDAGTGGSQHGN